MKENIYTAEQWAKDRTFKADAGQQIEASIYEEMLNCMPPKSLPRETAQKALREYNVPVHAGFLMGEPNSTNEAGQQLYLAFGMNDYGSGTKKEPKYFYLGLSVQEETLNGNYYYFDCMNAFLTERYFKETAFKGDSEAIETAANYEATLYKYTFKDGEPVETITLYDPFNIFED